MEKKLSTSRIDEALEMSAAMLRLAESGDWEGVTRLTQDRQSALADLFSSASEPPDQLAGCIKGIQEIDRRILEYAAAQRRSLGERLSTLEKGRRVHAAYAQVAAD